MAKKSKRGRKRIERKKITKIILSKGGRTAFVWNPKIKEYIKFIWNMKENKWQMAGVAYYPSILRGLKLGRFEKTRLRKLPDLRKYKYERL